MAKGPPWTKDEILILTRMWPKERAKFIGHTLGRTRASVIGMAHRLGLEDKRMARVGWKQKSGKLTFKGFW